jgi:hypothetical protein
VLNYLVELKIEIANISSKIGSILAAKEVEDNSMVEFNIPLFTHEDLETFENKLIDAVARKKLVCFKILKFCMYMYKYLSTTNLVGSSDKDWRTRNSRHNK